MDLDPAPDPHGSTLIWLSWILIRKGNVYQVSDPGVRKLTKINKSTSFPAFQTAFVPRRYAL